MDRPTPPSARTAAPLVAEESGLQRKAAIAATSSGCAKRRSNELGRTLRKNSCSNCSRVWLFCPARLLMKRLAPSDAVGPGISVLTVTPVPAVGLGEAAGDGQLRGLRHSVVNHLGGGLGPGVPRSETE